MKAIIFLLVLILSGCALTGPNADQTNTSSSTNTSNQNLNVAQYVPGEVLVYISPASTTSAVVEKLENNGFQVNLSRSVLAANVIITAIGDTTKDVPNATNNSALNELVNATIVQLESSNSLTCTSGLQLSSEALLTCRFEDAAEDDISTLLSANNITQSEIFNTRLLVVEVPIQEEEIWADSFTEWEEIEAASVNGLSEFN